MIHKHLCIKEHKNPDWYIVRTCKACDENKVLKNIREKFNDMMKVSLSWDIEVQGEIL